MSLISNVKIGFAGLFAVSTAACHQVPADQPDLRVISSYDCSDVNGSAAGNEARVSVITDRNHPSDTAVMTSYETAKPDVETQTIMYRDSLKVGKSYVENEQKLVSHFCKTGQLPENYTPIQLKLDKDCMDKLGVTPKHPALVRFFN